MSRRLQFRLKWLDRKVGPITCAVVGIAIGAGFSWAFTLRSYGYSAEFGRWPIILGATFAFGTIFLAAGLLEPFVERRRN